MSYTLTFTNQSVDPVGKAPIVVPVGAVDNTSTDLNLTGKGAANHGSLQQLNLLHLLENFASPTAPANPTVGQIWYDSVTKRAKVLISSSPDTWSMVGGLQIGGAAPSPAALGDLWFDVTGTSSGTLYTYTGVGRYPLASTTIGGWEQVSPSVVTVGGRDEYDEIRNLLEQLAGEAVSSYGNGAIGRAITNLTNFTELDRDLRAKYRALGQDTNVLTMVAADPFITRQAISNSLSATLFVRQDTGGTVTNDFYISGSRDTQTFGSIYIDGVLSSVPAEYVVQQAFVDDGFIIWNTSATFGAGGHFAVARQNDALSSFWEYDNGTTWVQLYPTATMYVIGAFATYQAGNVSTLPGGRYGFVWTHAVPMLASKIEHLRVSPNSNDWDALLAACKYALRRLELPAGYYREISELPFVHDGRQAPADLLALSASDVRYPSGRRRSRASSVLSLMRSYGETVNALSVGIENRFSLRGINGGTSTEFTVSTSPDILLTGYNFAANANLARIRFRFNSTSELYRWFCGGQGLQVTLTSASGGSTGDAELHSILSNRGTWRITADRTRFFDSTLTQSAAPSLTSGFWNSAPASTASQSQGGTALEMYAVRVSATAFDLVIRVTPSTALTLGVNIDARYIVDSNATLALPQPLAFTSADVNA